MKYIILLFLLGCRSNPAPLSEADEISPEYYDKNHEVVCYEKGDSISCLQLNK